MRVLLSTYGSRGDVEPMVALAVRLRELGAEVRVCAPPDEEFVELLAGVDVPLMPFGRAWRSWERPSTAEERSRRVAEFIAAQYDTVAAAVVECDVLLATGMSHFVAGSVAEKLAIPHGYATFAPMVLDGLFAQDWNAAHDGPAPTTKSLSAALSKALTPETRARATDMAGAIRTDGAAVAATLLLDAVSRERPPVSA